MKFYCELNKQFYDTPEECEAAEAKLLEAKDKEKRIKEEDEEVLAALRKDMAAAREECKKADNAFMTARKAFNKCAEDYYHKYGQLPKGYSLNIEEALKFFFS